MLEDPPPPTDDALMAAAASGDQRAFAVLVERHEAGVRRFCGALAGASGDDLAQEVFVRLWQHRGRYQASARFRPYLYTIARNLCRSAERKERLRRVLRLGEVEPSIAAPRYEEERLVRRAVAELDEAHRVPLLLKYYGGLSYEEIAGLLRIPLPTARTRVFYALRRLRERLPAEV